MFFYHASAPLQSLFAQHILELAAVSGFMNGKLQHKELSPSWTRMCPRFI